MRLERVYSSVKVHATRALALTSCVSAPFPYLFLFSLWYLVSLVARCFYLRLGGGSTVVLPAPRCLRDAPRKQNVIKLPLTAARSQYAAQRSQIAQKSCEDEAPEFLRVPNLGRTASQSHEVEAAKVEAGRDIDFRERFARLFPQLAEIKKEIWKTSTPMRAIERGK